MTFLLQVMHGGSPEINGTQSDEHASQHRSLLSQHNGPIIIEPPVKQRGAYQLPDQKVNNNGRLCCINSAKVLSWQQEAVRIRPIETGSLTWLFLCPSEQWTRIQTDASP